MFERIIQKHRLPKRQQYLSLMTGAPPSVYRHDEPSQLAPYPFPQEHNVSCERATPDNRKDSSDAGSHGGRLLV